MLLRLLIALLMTAGPVPVRFCTCAAGDAEHQHSNDGDEPEHTHPVPHEPDCPAVAAQNAALPALAPISFDHPSTDSLSALDAPVRNDSPGVDESPPADQFRSRSVPRFIAHQAMLI